MQGGGNSAYHQEHTPTHSHLYPSMRRPSLYFSRDDASALQSLPHSPTMHSAPRGEDAPVCNAPGVSRARTREKLSSTLLSQIMFSRYHYSPAHQHYRLTPKMLLTYHFMWNLSRSSFLHSRIFPLSGGEHGPGASKSSIKYDQRYLRRRFGARDRACSGGRWGIHTFDSQHKLGQGYVEPTHGKQRACIYAFIVCMHVFV